MTPPSDTTNDNALPAERRANPRQRVLLSGKLAYARNAVTADCAIRNLSETGAMVMLPALPLPADPFLIVIKQAFVHEARTVWRRDDRSGLKFLASWRLKHGAPQDVAPLRDLWLELLPH